MGSLICFVLPALMTISVTTVSQTKQKYQAQVYSVVTLTYCSLLVSTSSIFVYVVQIFLRFASIAKCQCRMCFIKLKMVSTAYIFHYGELYKKLAV